MPSDTGDEMPPRYEDTVTERNHRHQGVKVIYFAKIRQEISKPTQQSKAKYANSNILQNFKLAVSL